MLSLIRSLINSRLGVIITMVVLGVIAVLFAATDVSGLRSAGISNLTGTANKVATVGDAGITADELKKRVQADIENFRAQQPGLTVQQYIEGGGLDGSLDRMINGLVFDKFAAKADMVVSKKAVDAQLAEIPAFKGLDGKFDQKAYDSLLAQRRLTDKEIRQDVVRGTLSQQIILPHEGASQVPIKVAAPYAALLLERRAGQVGFIPVRAMGAGVQPTALELQTFYRRNQGRYTIPERRIARYALVTPEQVRQSAPPTDAEIAAAYRRQGARFAASEKRSVSQVVITDRAAADALAAKVKGGTPIATAARAIGLDAAKLEGLDRSAYQTQTSADAATAVFGAPDGATIGPVKAPLGWIVAHVDRIEKVPAKTLAEVRSLLTDELAKDKAARVMADLNAQIDDAINKSATFAEIVASKKLQPMTTPAVGADGRDPTNPALNPNPLVAPIIKAAFAAEPGDDPQIVPIGTDGGFAVVTLDKVLPPTTPPLDQLRPIIARDFTIDRARRNARTVALQVIAKVNAGTPLSDALKGTGLPLPPPQPLDATRAAIQASRGQVPAPIAFAFTMAPKTAKLLEAPEQGGWLIVYLDRIEKGDVKGQPAIVAAEQRDLGGAIGREYAQQLIAAIRRELKVTRHEDVIAKVRADLLGSSTGAQ